jgi:hypothetical protein
MEATATMIDRAVTMFGSSRAQWSISNIKAAAKLGDAASKKELAGRSK